MHDLKGGPVDAKAAPRKFILRDAPLGKLAENYLEAMLACERNRAGDLVMEAVERGTSIRDIYLHVFQPVQYEIGWLWQTGLISVGHEHYCTNSTQLIMSMLYPKLFSGKRSGKRMLAACVQGELHELGLRMLTDFFEMDGWDTQFLGANTPVEGVVRILEEWRADMLAVGVTMHYHLDEAQKLIGAVRGSPRGRDTLVLVGGYTCLVVDNLWQKLGADGTAPDARHAIELASKLIERRPKDDWTGIRARDAGNPGVI